MIDGTEKTQNVQNAQRDTRNVAINGLLRNTGLLCHDYIEVQ